VSRPTPADELDLDQALIDASRALLAALSAAQPDEAATADARQRLRAAREARAGG
jgi:hypothetical protein